MKICTICKIEKDESMFCKKRNGLNSRCRECDSKIKKDHYSKNKDYYKGKASKQKAELKAWYIEYKSNLSCIVCNESESICLDFHHLDSEQKEHEISQLIANGRTKELVLSEIEKCIVVCSNCHRKIHAGIISLAEERRLELLGQNIRPAV